MGASPSNRSVARLSTCSITFVPSWTLPSSGPFPALLIIARACALIHFQGASTLLKVAFGHFDSSVLILPADLERKRHSAVFHVLQRVSSSVS